MAKENEWRIATPEENAEAEEILHQHRLRMIGEWQQQLETMRSQIDEMLTQLDEFELVLA
jgi:hypothetical protein